MAPKRSNRKLSVAVTGASGYVAERLIEDLVADASIERVLGFDVRPPRGSFDKFVFDEIDVRSEALEGRFRGIDIVIHLAFIMDPIKDETAMRDVNVNGSQNVFRCAGRAGVKKVVYTSSATVYGAHPDNDFPLTEESPLRANLDFSYPAHKLEVEYVVKEVAREFPKLKFLVYRPAIVFGPHVDNAWSHALEAPVLLGVKGHSPPLQFVHETDVARALHFGVTEDIDGYFNLAARGWLDADEMLAIVGRKRWDLPEPLAFSMLDRMWSVGAAEAPAGMLHYVMHPWVVSIDKLEAAGFSPERSNLETFTEVAERAHGHVRVGGARMNRSKVAKFAVAGAGVAGALAAVRAVRARA